MRQDTAPTFAVGRQEIGCGSQSRLAAELVFENLPAVYDQLLIEFVQRPDLWDWYEEPSAGVVEQPFNVSILDGTPDQAEVVLE